MILGLHNMVESVVRYYKDHVASDGGSSIVLLDGILLIPMIFAVFFYPVQVFASLAVITVLTLVFLVLMRVLENHRHHVGHH